MGTLSALPRTLLPRLLGVAFGAALRLAAVFLAAAAFEAVGAPPRAVVAVGACLCAAWAAQRALRSFLSPDVQAEIALLWLGRHLDHRDPVFGALRRVMDAFADPARAGRALDRVEAPPPIRPWSGRFDAVLGECRRRHGERVEARARIFLVSQVLDMNRRDGEVAVRVRRFLSRPEFRPLLVPSGSGGLDAACGRLLDALLHEE